MLISKRRFIKTAALFGASHFLPACSSGAAYNAGSAATSSRLITPSARPPHPANTYVSHGSLSKQINTAVQKMRREGRIASDERTAWEVTDIKTGNVLAAINVDVPMQCASMVKPMVIQAYLYCHFLKNPKLYPLNDKVMKEMRGMIVDSNNAFTNRIFKRLGGPEGVQWILRKQAPSIFRHIHIVENIPKGGRTYLNRASASDYTRFLHAIWHQKLPGSNILKELMGIKNHDRISVKTAHIPKSITVYDKTGSTARLCGDFGIIAHRDGKGVLRPYTFTGIIEKKRSASNYSRWISARSDIMREISDMAYLYIIHQTKA